MKTMKKLASIFFAAMMCLAMGAFAACGGDKPSDSTSESTSDSSIETTLTAYEFTLVYDNGDPASDLSVQLCVGSDMCYQPIKADAEGKVSYKPMGFPGEGVYEIHVLDASYQQVEFEGAKTTSATYEAITLTIKK